MFFWYTIQSLKVNNVHMYINSKYIDKISTESNKAF